MGELLAIKDFTITQVKAWQVSCDRCRASHFVVGDGAATEALDWAQDHFDRTHRKADAEVAQ